MYYRVDNKFPLNTALTWYHDNIITESDLYLGKPLYSQKPLLVNATTNSNKSEILPNIFTELMLLSESFLEFLLPLELHRCNYLPARILINGKRQSGYFYWHIYNYISCINPDKSILHTREDGSLEIEKMVLNHNMLASIPLNLRLVFRLDEDPNTVLVHEKLVGNFTEYNADAKFTKVEMAAMS